MLTAWFRRIAAIVVLVPVAPSADAASVEVVRAGVDTPIVVVAGELRPGDSEVFDRATENLGQAIVVFDSPGGALLEGIAIGRLVHRRGFVTAVTSGDVCTSACALAFLGGSLRLLDRAGFVGFHAAWAESDGTKAETGAGNALAGAYLASLGLSDRAIFYMTVAPPDDIAELTPAIAQTLDIAVEFVGEPGYRAHPMTAVPAPQPASPSPLALDDIARASVVEHFGAAASLSPERWLAYAADAYALRVEFYGERMSRATVLQRSSEYMRRWPTRANTLTSDPFVLCANSRCVVTGTADFVAENAGRNARSSGSIRYRLELEMAADRPLIVDESTETVSRTMLPLVAGGSTLAAKLQRALGRLGCYSGAIDGVWGTGSQKAMARFNAASGRQADTELPTASALTAATGLSAPRCKP